MILIQCSLFLIVFFIGVQAQNNETHRVFPDNFLFGVATSAYQIEGGWIDSDRGENIWDRLIRTTNFVKDGSNADTACDSYNKYKRDVEMIKELGVDYYRFSISWSRILPNGVDNMISVDGVNYYNRLIDLLLENNITPVVTLYHYDLPQPLQDIGGWPNPLLEKYFSDYARIAFWLYGDRVKDWLTFNEPIITCQLGYGGKDSAPALGFEGIGEYLCAHTVIKAHARTYHLYDEEFRSTQNGRVGLTFNIGWHEPEDPNSAADVEASERAYQFKLGWYAHPILSDEGDYPTIMKERIGKFSEQQGYSTSRLPSFTPEEINYIKGTADFFGLNHYTSVMVRHSDTEDEPAKESFTEDLGIVEYQPSDWPSSASGWLKVTPWGLPKILVWIKNEYNNPEIIIFENGFSDTGELEDENRVNYLFLYMNAVLDALEQGVKLTGYTVWSLLDNFEWGSGYTEKFGLYHVNFTDPLRTRTPKASASFYSNIVKSKALPRA